MTKSNDTSRHAIDAELAALTAGHFALRRFVLEAHSKATGEPMNRAERRLWDYMDEEFEKILEHARKLSPEFAKALEAFRQPPPAA